MTLKWRAVIVMSMASTNSIVTSAFVYTPRVKYGIIRLGAQLERYSFGFDGSGQQFPNTLQALNAVVGFDTPLAILFSLGWRRSPVFTERASTLSRVIGSMFLLFLEALTS